MLSFKELDKKYKSDKLEIFNLDLSALLWLKIKSILRKGIFDTFLEENSIFLKSRKLSEQFEELYLKLTGDLNHSHHLLNNFIQSRKRLMLDEEKSVLQSELYKLRNFDWGGDYKNQLDKYLIDKYVKVYSNYDILVEKLDVEIKQAVQGYLLCSWYNHWSSILIEEIFRHHSIVLPALGQIKKVDFFIKDIPFDLKVTYLPTNFIEKKRKEKNLKPELTELKQKAKQAKIDFSSHHKNDDVYYEIVEKMKDKNDDFCNETLFLLKNTRLEILKESQQNPKDLIKNLYEQQGEMRFDASNRLFLILVDTDNFDNSWKLKRNLNLLSPKIEEYLNHFSGDIENLKIEFNYKEKGQFTALSDIIFIIK